VEVFAWRLSAGNDGGSWTLQDGLAPRNRWGTSKEADDVIPQPKILLEGTHLNRKTDIAFALAEHVELIGHRKHRWHIPLISSEWQTKSDEQPTKSKPGRNMIDYLPGDDDWAREAFETYVRLMELHRDYYWVIDRFHVSAIAFQYMAHGRQVDLSWVDKRLADLGVLLVHCRRDPDSFGAARVLRLTYSENPHNYDDLRVFLREQELMQDIIDNSAMETYTVDVTDGDIGRVADDIVSEVRRRGLFYRTGYTDDGAPQEGLKNGSRNA
jgi:hypothetical protein